MNTGWALKELETFINQTEQIPCSQPNIIGTHTRASDTQIAGQAQIIEKILSRVLPKWRVEVIVRKGHKWNQHREAAIRAREELVREQEVKENLGENAPDLSAADLHPWVWSGASSLWQSGHFREAVEGAIKKLNAETQNKVERRDVSETDLFKQAFSLDTPKEGKARLRRMRDDGSDTYKSVQRGAMSLAEGVFAGIRNPLSHEANQELTEQEALEYLATLSVLARWVDGSVVKAAS
jgi:hypothetical protein